MAPYLMVFCLKNRSFHAFRGVNPLKGVQQKLNKGINHKEVGLDYKTRTLLSVGKLNQVHNEMCFNIIM